MKTTIFRELNVLSLILACTAGVLFHAGAVVEPVFKGPVPSQETEISAGMVLPEETEGEGISLTGVKISEEEYAAYGIPAAAESAQEITATVYPSNEATNTEIEWDMKWQERSDDFSEPYDVSNFITLSPGAGVAGSKKCTVTCTSAFSTPIVITARAKEKPTVTAETVAEYVQKITDFSLSFGSLECSLGATDRSPSPEPTHVTVELGDGAPVGGLPQLNVVGSQYYTIAAQYEVSYKLSPAREDQIVTWSKYASFGTAYVGFFDYRSDSEAPAKHDFSGYNVQSKGLYFDLNFLHENLGLCAYFQTGEGNNYRQEAVGTIKSYLIGAYIDRNQPYYDWQLNNYLFDLTVTLTTQNQTLAKSTRFLIRTCINSAEIGSVDVDKSEIYF